MPKFAPLTKVVNCRKLGATVLLEGNNIAEARARADELVSSQGLKYISGFDDPEIIAGQGTLGLEIASQVPQVDAVIVPVGGGGLIAGMALALDIAHDRAFSTHDISQVAIHCVLETRDETHIRALLTRLGQEGFVAREQS